MRGPVHWLCLVLVFIKLKFETKYFNELSVKDLHEIYFLRNLVFIVEQNCPYQDVDELDLEALHLFHRSGGSIIAYLRIIPPENRKKYPRIGRVVVQPQFRRKGISRHMMKEAMVTCRSLWPELTIQLSAQLYLLRFYESLGFIAKGEQYLEDGIPHIAMYSPPNLA